MENQTKQSIEQAAYIIQKAIDRLGKNVKPTGADIPSSAIEGEETVDAALTELATRTEKDKATFAATIGTVTATGRVCRRGDIVKVYLSAGATTGTPFANVSSGDSIGTMPEGFRPDTTQRIDGYVRTEAAWASASYSYVSLLITPEGDIQIGGNTNEIRAGRYVNFNNVAYFVDEI